MTVKKFFDGICCRVERQNTSREVDNFMGILHNCVDDIMKIVNQIPGKSEMALSDSTIKEIYEILDEINIQCVKYQMSTNLHQACCDDGTLISCFAFDAKPVLTIGDFIFHGDLLYIGNDPHCIAR